MSLSITEANAYFARGAHVCAEEWQSQTAERRAAALNTAKQELTRILGRAINPTATTMYQMPREDVALYEQAMHLLRNMPADGTVPGFQSQDPGNPEDPRPQDTGRLSESARRWLSAPRRNGFPSAIIEMNRG